MKNTFVLASSLFLLLISARAQDRSLPGYIVRVSGDTLRGFLKEQGTDESAKGISFKASATDNDYQVYSFNEVKSFQYTGGNLFRAITFSDTRKEEERATRTFYGNLMVSGECDLYTFTEEGVLYFLARKDSSFYLMYDDDLRSLPYVKGNFRNELNFFAVSCDVARREIDRIDYTLGNVMEFFQKLDACLNPNRSVQSYYHKAEGKASVFAYVGGIPLGNQSQFTAEVRLRLVWPQLNPNVSFNLGLRYAAVAQRVVDPYYTVATIYHHETYQIKSLPLTVQYNLTHGVVQPFVFAGLSLCTVNIVTDDPELIGDDPYYHHITLAALVGAGVEVRLTHVLRARAEWRYEYMWQYPTAGLTLTLP
jgi:opacity protein-like surface antigen